MTEAKPRRYVVRDERGQIVAKAELRQMLIAAIKIDRRFVQAAPGTVQDAAIVKSLLDLGRTLELRVVAEGVETAEQLALLRELDARLGRSDYSPASLDLALRLAAQFPEMTKARFLAGSLLLVRGRAPEAIPHLEWVVSREPRHVSALANLGNAYASVGRPKDAAAKFREALSLDPRNAAAQSGLRALGS